MSSSKRHFTVVEGSKEHGLYISSSPSSAARKIVSKLCSSNKSKKVQFFIREITQGSKKKTYGPYLGEMKKLAKPIELKGRVIKYAPSVYLDKKKSAKNTVKKNGKKMKGGADIDVNDFICKNGQECKEHKIKNNKYIFFGIGGLDNQDKYYRYVAYETRFFPFTKAKFKEFYPEINGNGIINTGRIEEIGIDSILFSELDKLRTFLAFFYSDKTHLIKIVNNRFSYLRKNIQPISNRPHNIFQQTF